MGFKLGTSSLKGMFSKPATKMYPVVVPEYFERTAGHVEMVDIKNCIMCGICEKRCPTGCITVDKNDGEGSWSIDPYDCIMCNSCVRECPKNCLVTERTYTAPATTKQVTKVCKPELTPEEKAEKERIAAEKAAKAKAAKEAAAKKKAEKAAAEAAAAASEAAPAVDAPAAPAADAAAPEAPKDAE